ncbi:MAG: ABC transporter substrate-binding protein [Burkholderiales bacterium]|nr:ABC transporter substrate-binding protein [Burkholderiales bacterium]
MTQSRRPMPGAPGALPDLHPAMPRRPRRRALQAAAQPAAWLALPTVARAHKRYGPGVTDAEIRIGQTMPFSGPVSMLGVLGKTSGAYFDKLNAEGGINGRRVKLLSFDDAYSPPRAVEGTRRLVEQEEVLPIDQTIGTPTSIAIHRYLNGRKVPQLLIMSGANRWNDPKQAPWTLSGMVSYHLEGRWYAQHALATVKDPRIPVLDATVDSQMLKLRDSGMLEYYAFMKRWAPSPDDHELYGAVRLQRFDGQSWVPFGEPMKR